jgi:hypothetical protein
MSSKPKETFLWRFGHLALACSRNQSEGGDTSDVLAVATGQALWSQKLVRPGWYCVTAQARL